jgi:hypothetical protein
MPDYLLEGPKPARMFEVILPKKIGYFGKVEVLLQDALPFGGRQRARHGVRSLDVTCRGNAWNLPG